MTMTVSQTSKRDLRGIRKTFDDNGYVVIRDAIDQNLAREMGDHVDWLLAPLWKLPPAARRPLRSFWTRSRFYEALGSQIATMPVSAQETLDAARHGYGDLPLVTISMTDPGDHRLRQQEALARLSSQGRHVVAARSGHWIPLDEPDLIVAEVRSMHAALTEQASSPSRVGPHDLNHLR